MSVSPLVAAFYDRIWNAGDLTAIDEILGVPLTAVDSEIR
jgi:hypothetical protein